MDTKWVLASRGVMGALIPFVAGILTLFGWNIAPEILAEISNQLLGILLAVAGIIALWSRLRQDGKTITLLPNGQGSKISKNIGAVGLLFLVLPLVAACASNPIRIAETPAQKFYAAHGQFNIVAEFAAAYIEDANADPRVVTALREIFARGYAGIKAGQQALARQDESTDQGLRIAASLLNLAAGEIERLLQRRE